MSGTESSNKSEFFDLTSFFHGIFPAMTPVAPPNDASLIVTPDAGKLTIRDTSHTPGATQWILSQETEKSIPATAQCLPIAFEPSLMITPPQSPAIIMTTECELVSTSVSSSQSSFMTEMTRPRFTTAPSQSPPLMRNKNALVTTSGPSSTSSWSLYSSQFPSMRNAVFPNVTSSTLSSSAPSSSEMTINPRITSIDFPSVSVTMAETQFAICQTSSLLPPSPPVTTIEPEATTMISASLPITTTEF